jgi:hypothetical protein
MVGSCVNCFEASSTPLGQVSGGYQRDRRAISATIAEVSLKDREREGMVPSHVVPVVPVEREVFSGKNLSPSAKHLKPRC